MEIKQIKLDNKKFFNELKKYEKANHVFQDGTMCYYSPENIGLPKHLPYTKEHERVIIDFGKCTYDMNGYDEQGYDKDGKSWSYEENKRLLLKIIDDNMLNPSFFKKHKEYCKKLGCSTIEEICNMKDLCLDDYGKFTNYMVPLKDI